MISDKEGVVPLKLLKALIQDEEAQNCFVRDRWVMGRNGWEGDWCWSRDLRGRAHDELSALIATLSEVALSSDRPDSWRWGLVNNGVFSVKRLSSLVDKVLHDGITTIL
nr:hypothetical protein [Tanacetum cinerariifolium]